MKKIELVNLKHPAGGLSKWLEVRVILKWSRDAALNSSSAQSSNVFCRDSSRSRAQSFGAARLSKPHSPQNAYPWSCQGITQPCGEQCYQQCAWACDREAP